MQDDRPGLIQNPYECGVTRAQSSPHHLDSALQWPRQATLLARHGIATRAVSATGVRADRRRSLGGPAAARRDRAGMLRPQAVSRLAPALAPAGEHPVLSARGDPSLGIASLAYPRNAAASARQSSDRQWISAASETGGTAESSGLLAASACRQRDRLGTCPC